MIIVQKLSSKWEQQTGNTINWVVLEETILSGTYTLAEALKKSDASAASTLKRAGYYK